jgi:DNA-directed RNA polymerase subunit RPC12/RpoP
MAELSNFQCSHCGAKLLLKRRTEPKKYREAAVCPYCSVNLPPREGKDTLQYTLVEPPASRKR